MILRGLLLLGMVVVLLAAGVAWWGWETYEGEGPLAEERHIVIERGTGLRSMARALEDEGIIDNALVFALAARLQEQHHRLKAGEYAFAPGASMRDVLDKIVVGDSVVRRITIAEGLTTAEALRRVAEAEGMVGDVPSSVPEGALLPDTYHYSWGDDRAKLVERMRNGMDEVVMRHWESRDSDLPLESPEEMVVLASIVERETAVPEERALVASVFVNRLRRGMRLQSDPTVIYAASGGQGALDRPLTRTDLETEHPYNTYTTDGLPPGPIANPGVESLAAVARPVESDYYYFVADGSGGHAFGRTLDEHNRNVAHWRRIQRDRAVERERSGQ